MFSFFRKKPPPPAPAETADPIVVVPTTPTDRPKTALEWLNTDVGELFGRKNAAATAPAGKEPAGEQQASSAQDEALEALQPSAGPIGAAAATAPEAKANVQAAPARTPAVESDTSPAVSPFASSRAEPPAVAAEPDRRAWVSKLKSGLRKTGSGIAQAFVGATLDDAMYDDLEAALLQADAGAAATQHLLDDLQRRVSRTEFRDPAAVRRLLARCLADLLAPLEQPLVIGEHMPTVIMVVGVNGAGKTTSVGKLARHLIDLDQRVLLAAADTFRAAAREQLLAWAERAGAEPDGAALPVSAGAGTAAPSRIEIVSRQGGDPAGLTFDAVTAAVARGFDVVIADTAGRLATQAHLMEELKKIKRTIGKAQAGAPHEILLVLDGNTGQNALNQAQAFDAALDLTGLVITKLDGTAKGGVLAAIALWSRSRIRPLPVYYVGVGEKLADLQTFRADEFADALVS